MLPIPQNVHYRCSPILHNSLRNSDTHLRLTPLFRPSQITPHYSQHSVSFRCSTEIVV